MSNPSIALSEENRVFRHWCNPKAGCDSGQTICVYANEHGVVINGGGAMFPYTNPELLRELIAGLELAADRMEELRR